MGGACKAWRNSARLFHRAGVNERVLMIDPTPNFELLFEYAAEYDSYRKVRVGYGGVRILREEKRL